MTIGTDVKPDLREVADLISLPTDDSDVKSTQSDSSPLVKQADPGAIDPGKEMRLNQGTDQEVIYEKGSASSISRTEASTHFVPSPPDPRFLVQPQNYAVPTSSQQNRNATQTAKPKSEEKQSTAPLQNVVDQFAATTTTKTIFLMVF